MNIEKQQMIRHGLSLESPFHRQTGYLTPLNQFFVCNSGTTPHINPDNYQLRLHGDGVGRTLSLSYQQLLELPHRQVPAVLECAGNHRAFYRDVDHMQLPTLPGSTELIWSTGAVGMAIWGGVSLRDVLTLASLKPNACQVCASGSETDSCEGLIQLPLPIDKACDPDTLLALTMNGRPLPADHGFPARLLVPGWIGAYSIKWVQDIEVSTVPLRVRRNTVSYTLQGDQWPAQHYAPANGAPITQLNIKSSLALPWPATLAAGHHLLHGYARTSGKRISQVEWSDDHGGSWQRASLAPHTDPYGWVPFSFAWLAKKGSRVLMTRARDVHGNTQPTKATFNAGGYLYNAIHPHPVEVG